MKTLILGGVKSGKTRYAESIAKRSQLPVTVIATAEALDPEMQQRIAQHKADRPADWSVLEVPLQLSEALQTINACSGTTKSNTTNADKTQSGIDQYVIVDCLTLWLTQHCRISSSPVYLSEQRHKLVDAVQCYRGDLVLVSNETNLGVTPMGELSRVFCDQTGLLHQSLAQCCDHVFLVVAGLPQQLK